MANEWNKTAFVEFDAMLRRHLRSGAAPVAACAGFDLDAASAYLEGALGGSHRAGYESHLAGCATCRRHLIELARLARCAPQAVAQPVTVTDQTPAWVRWREIVVGWFDLSAWNWKWQIAGATGAAFAILIAMLGAQSWRPASDQTAGAFAPNATPPPLAGSGVQPPTVEPSPQGVAVPGAGDLVANNQEQSRVPLPTPPPVGPKVEAPEAAVMASDKFLALSVNQSVEAPVVAKPGDAGAGQNPPPQPRAFADMASSDRTGEPVQVARIAPPHDYNPMNHGQPEPDHETPLPTRRQPKKPSEALKLPGIATSLIARIKSGSKSESGRKENAKASEDESPKPMLIPIRDKVFRFEKGMLIDRQYNPERQEWRVWTLKSGSEAYKQVLANEPLLKEFFDRGPILIVWKNRIYKVLK